MNLTRDNTFSFDLNATFGENHAVEAPGNYHPIAFDLSFNLRAFTQNHGLFGDDVPFYVAVDAERAGDSQCPIEGDALIDETRPFFIVSAVLCYAGPLPRHDDPQERLFPL